MSHVSILSDTSTMTNNTKPILRLKSPEELLDFGDKLDSPGLSGLNYMLAKSNISHKTPSPLPSNASSILNKSNLSVFNDRGRAGKTRGSETMLTQSPPIYMGKNKPFQNCRILYIHFQASICTEWEQSSMVLTPGSQTGARVMSSNNNNNNHHYNYNHSNNINHFDTNKNKSVSSILQALAGSDAMSRNPQKKPKTIHRCILQRGSKAKNPKLKCHVCDYSYNEYKDYFDHLINNACAEQKKAKDKALNTCNKVIKDKKSQNITLWRKASNRMENDNNNNNKDISSSNKNGSLQHFHFLDAENQSRRKKENRAIIADDSDNLLAEEIRIEKMLVEAEEMRNRKRKSPPSSSSSSSSSLLNNLNSAMVRTGRHLSGELLEGKKLNYVNEERGKPLNLSLTSSPNRLAAATTTTTSSAGSSYSSSRSDDTSPDSYSHHSPNSIPDWSMPSLLPIKKRKSSHQFNFPTTNVREKDEEDFDHEQLDKCVHVQVATLPNLTLMEHAEDQAKLANLKVQLTGLLVSLLGELKLSEMGYPETDILALLKSVLVAAKAVPYESDSKCQLETNCKDFIKLLAPNQIRFRRTRQEIRASRLNVLKLLKICVPEMNIWNRYGWTSKNVEEILTDIKVMGIRNIAN